MDHPNPLIAALKQPRGKPQGTSTYVRSRNRRTRSANQIHPRAAQVPAVRKSVTRIVDYDDSLGAGAWSKDRASNRPEIIPEPEHEPEWRVKTRPFSIQVPDAPVWIILDRTTGCTFARVRGSLLWVVNQLRSVASQLGGLEYDLYFKRAEQ